jgi:hypothetical protein
MKDCVPDFHVVGVVLPFEGLVAIEPRYWVYHAIDHGKGLLGVVLLAGW